MELIVFQKQYAKSDAAQEFVNKIYQKDMTYLASELLDNGVHPDDIKLAVKKAMLSIDKVGLKTNKHFQPVVSAKNGTTFLDCRLSKMGFFMVVLNAEPKNNYIAHFQVKMAQQLLKKEDIS